MYRFIAVLGAAVIGLTSAVSLHAQQGPLEIAYFVTVQDENIPDLEEGIRDHVQWHEEQNDPWSGAVWQAVTGPQEYVWIIEGRSWADLDSPPIDLTADAVDWAETGAPHSDGVNIWLWEPMLDVSLPPAQGSEVNVVQVFEFSMNPGGEEALAHVLAKYREAAEAVAPGARFIWYQVLSGSQGTSHFIVVPAGSFAEFGMDVPEPPEILMQHYGPTEARELFDMFGEAMTFRQARMWALRPDLSYNLP